MQMPRLTTDLATLIVRAALIQRHATTTPQLPKMMVRVRSMTIVECAVETTALVAVAPILPHATMTRQPSLTMARACPTTSVCGGDNSTCSGCTDPDAGNYDATATVDDGSCILGGEDLTLTLLTDNYPGETTWTVSDLNGNIVAQGGPYAETGTEYVEQICIDPDATRDHQRLLRRWHVLCLW